MFCVALKAKAAQLFAKVPQNLENGARPQPRSVFLNFFNYRMATVLTVSLCFTALTTHKGTEQCGEVYGSILLLVLLYGIFRNVDMMFTFRR